MSTSHRLVLALALLSGSLASCQTPLASRKSEAIAAVKTTKTTAKPAQTAVPKTNQPDSYTQAIARASAAYSISKSAQSRDDWRLVAARWQQAIDLMAAVPTSSPNHAEAARKLADYRRDLAYAQSQANQPVASSGDGRISQSTAQSSSITQNPPRSAAAPTAASPILTLPPSSRGSSGEGDRDPEGGVFYAPIVRRAGNTPVIAVTFNGNQTYEMILDTGASGTLITAPMASSLGIQAVGQTSVDTASAQGVSFSLGYVDSIEVGGAVAQNVLVAMAGPELSLGLLGHDFFGNYDIIIRESEVEFRER
jgi:predicted aspartyl protease